MFYQAQLHCLLNGQISICTKKINEFSFSRLFLYFHCIRLTHFYPLYIACHLRTYTKLHNTMAWIFGIAKNASSSKCRLILFSFLVAKNLNMTNKSQTEWTEAKRMSKIYDNDIGRRLICCHHINSFLWFIQKVAQQLAGTGRQAGRQDVSDLTFCFFSFIQWFYRRYTSSFICFIAVSTYSRFGHAFKLE